MLTLETEFGNFGNFENILLFMQEENLQSIEIINVHYVLQDIFGKGVYSLNDVKKIVEMNKEL